MAQGKTRDGETLRTKDPDTIQQWVEERGTKPATIQETTSDGTQSNFFRLTNPDREDG